MLSTDYFSPVEDITVLTQNIYSFKTASEEQF